jgi:hypothetical protein
MKLENIINIANEAYPDGLIAQAAEEKNVGDGLAQFIATELTETFDPDSDTAEQLIEAVRCMTTAQKELMTVTLALQEALDKELGI